MKNKIFWIICAIVCFFAFSDMVFAANGCLEVCKGKLKEECCCPENSEYYGQEGTYTKLQNTGFECNYTITINGQKIGIIYKYIDGVTPLTSSLVDPDISIKLGGKTYPIIMAELDNTMRLELDDFIGDGIVDDTTGDISYNYSCPYAVYVAQIENDSSVFADGLGYKLYFFPTGEIEYKAGAPLPSYKEEDDLDGNKADGSEKGLTAQQWALLKTSTGYKKMSDMLKINKTGFGGWALDTKLSKYACHIATYDKETDEVIDSYDANTTHSDLDDIADASSSDPTRDIIDTIKDSVADCTTLSGTKTYKIINKIFMWIQIAAPIMVVIFGVLDFTKAMAASDNDAIKKAQSTFIKRIIVAAIIILLPVIMNLVIDLYEGATGINTCGIGE